MALKRQSTKSRLWAIFALFRPISSYFQRIQAFLSLSCFLALFGPFLAFFGLFLAILGLFTPLASKPF
jgi:hypothetical protein